MVNKQILTPKSDLAMSKTDGILRNSLKFKFFQFILLYFSYPPFEFLFIK